MTADDTVTAKLAEWEALVEGATEGEWSWIRDTRVSGERVCRIGSLPGNHDVGWTPRGNGEADAEFIAAAPAIATALLGFVREVLEGHEPMDWCPNPRHDAEGVCPECVVTCVKDGHEWPCPTEQAAQKWVGGEG